jgi:hypothetical protein
MEKVADLTLEEQEHVFEYLDDLRVSGVTNMLGAGPYIMRNFGVTRAESHKLLAEWMRTFKDRQETSKL